MECKICGANLPDNSKFCEQCGTPVVSANGQSAMIFAQAPDLVSVDQTPTERPSCTPESVAAPIAATAMEPEPMPEPVPMPEAVPDKPKPKKKTAMWIAVILGVVLLAAALVAGYFFVHIWKPATCTEPDCCRICGMERGEPEGHAWKDATCLEAQYCTACDEEGEPAKGHNWKNATCDEPKTCKYCSETKGEAKGHKWKDATCEKAETCSTCKQTRGEALGHDWEPATYEKKKTCKRCNGTEGEPLGYIGDVDGRWTDEKFNRNYSRAPVVQLERRLEKCFRFRMDIEILNLKYGSPYGKWQIFVRDDNGDWELIKTFDLETLNQTVYVELSKPVSFRDIVVLGQFDRNASFSYDYEISEVQCRVD